jgi:hypothetical protein
LFNVDGQTYGQTDENDKAIVAIRNFANVPEKPSSAYLIYGPKFELRNCRILFELL